MSGPNPAGEEGNENHEDFLVVFKRGLKLTEELLAENAKLRSRVADLEREAAEQNRYQSAADGDALVFDLKTRLKELEEERNRIQRSYDESEALKHAYLTRYSDVEDEHNNLANLYVASYQLHSTTSFREAVQVMSEVVINLVGVATFTMYLLDSRTGMLEPIACEGRPVEKAAAVALGAGPIGSAVKKRERVLSVAPASAAGTPEAPVAVIPLLSHEQTVGGIAIEQLLVQKDGFTAVDNELFTLLTVHGGTALLTSLLRENVGEEGLARALSIDHARKLMA